MSAPQRRGRAARPATSASSRPRRCTPRRRSQPPPTPSPTAPSRASRTGSATRRCSRRHCRARDPRHDLPGRPAHAPRASSPGRCKGETTLGPFEPPPAPAAEIARARRGLHARRHADPRGRGRARAAVAQGDLQRRHQPARRAHRPQPRRALRASRRCGGSPPSSSTRARRSPRRRGSTLDADPEALIDYAARPEVAYGHKASMLQDVEARRATEVDYLNGGDRRVRPPLRCRRRPGTRSSGHS